jgi:hypothetical protein
MLTLSATLTSVAPLAVHIHADPLHDVDTVTKLNVRATGIQVNLGATLVLPGCVYEPEVRSDSPRVKAAFGFADIRAVSFANLYAVSY